MNDSNNKLKYSMRNLREAYLQNKNIIQLLNEGNSDEFNLLNKMKYIEIAYDLQAGSYIKAMRDPEHAAVKTKKCFEMAEIVYKFLPNPKSLLKAGVGEAVTLVPFLNGFKSKIDTVHGFDISWSRVSHARLFLDENNYNGVNLCTGTLQEIPYVNNSFDVIMSSHSLEPNGGYEEVILKELMRVSSNIVALFEPSYEHASTEGKERMIKHGYVKDLPKIAQQLGFKVLHHAPMATSMSSLNPTAALILQVPNPTETVTQPKFACPITKSELISFDSGYISNESFMFYPMITNIPALRKENGILASAIYKNH
jgi:ubiquinone/menaquinone biosynthesis C-methylase UbiE